jgi:uncharacterized surface protein with fasciclin (FAS1) repeats
MFRFSSIVLSAVLCASALGQNQTIVDLAIATPELSTLVAAVSASPDVLEALNGTDPYTVFAPLNSAFESVDQMTLEKLLTPEYIAHLTNLLLFHAAEGTTTSSALSDGQTLTMANTETLTVSVQGGTVTVTPTTPNATGATVVTKDIEASNGVVHTIDQVLFPKWASTDLFALVEELKGQGYDTVIGLLDTLNLTSDLLNGQSVTVFAPSDEAFEKAPDEVKKYLNDAETYRVEITELLTSHVVIGRLYPTANLTSETMIKTINGKEWQVTVDDETYKIGDATIENADVLAIDGIIQGIDTVLITSSAPTATTPTTPTATPPTDGAPTATPPTTTPPTGDSGVGSSFYYGTVAAVIIGALATILA